MTTADGEFPPQKNNSCQIILGSHGRQGGTQTQESETREVTGNNRAWKHRANGDDTTTSRGRLRTKIHTG